jgi:pilus assembly protein CpaB
MKKFNKNWLLLSAAIGLGLLSAFLMNKAVQQRMDQLDAEANRGLEMVEVVVANRDLEKGDVLVADTVASRQVPKQYVHASAVVPASFSQIEDARLQVPLKRGEVVLPAHIDGLGQRVFSTILKKGMRALTFEVDEISSTAGMLRPGDRVDLIYSVMPSYSGASSERVLFPLLSNVSILATGQSVTKQDNRGTERRYTNVTLEVSPADANRILLAKSTGDLTAVLRSPDDQEKNSSAILTPDALIPGLPKKSGKPIAPVVPQEIEYLIGGGGGNAGVATLRG